MATKIERDTRFRDREHFLINHGVDEHNQRQLTDSRWNSVTYADLGQMWEPVDVDTGAPNARQASTELGDKPIAMFTLVAPGTLGSRAGRGGDNQLRDAGDICDPARG